MAYAYFHQPDDRLNALPAFHDSDGSPVYEHPNQGLLCSIIQQNDMAALNSYNACTHTSVFWKAYEFDDSCPFHIAIQNDSFDVLRELCRIYLSDAALTEPLEDYLARFHVSPVIAACATANRGMVSWLMSHDPPLGKLHDYDFEGHTALSRAAEALREAGNVAWEAKPEDRPAAQQRCDRIESFIRWLLECPQAGEQDDSDRVPMPRGTVLGDAVSYAGYDLVSRLIAAGADVHGRQVWHGGLFFAITDGHDVTPLHTAALSWNMDAIRALIDHRGDVTVADMVAVPDSFGRLPLHWALAGVSGNYADSVNSDSLSSRMTGTVKLLLDIRPDTVNASDQHGATAFHYAVKNNTGRGANIGALRLLLHAARLPETLNLRDDVGTTALGEVIEQHQWAPGRLQTASEILDMLLKHGADPRVCDSFGRNALHGLCSVSRCGCITASSMVDQLLDHLQINETDDLGYTALHYLVRNLDQVDAVRYLVSRGAHVNAVDLKGNTPLHEVMKGTIIKPMEERGNREETTGRLKQALDHKRNAIIQILLGAGASEEVVNAAGETPRQVLERVTEERARRSAAMYAGRGRGRGEVVGREVSA
jgi:ankyrin repeat protein